MTEQEKTEIIEELEARFDAKYKGILSHKDVATTLSEPRNKWFRGEDGGGYGSLMAEALGNAVVAWSVWEEIRKLTCRICGKSYVRQLTDGDKAGEVAETLCEMVYRLANNRKSEKED